MRHWRHTSATNVFLEAYNVWRERRNGVRHANPRSTRSTRSTQANTRRTLAPRSRLVSPPLRRSSASSSEAVGGVSGRNVRHHLVWRRTELGTRAAAAAARTGHESTANGAVQHLVHPIVRGATFAGLGKTRWWQPHDHVSPCGAMQRPVVGTMRDIMSMLSAFGSLARAVPRPRMVKEGRSPWRLSTQMHLLYRWFERCCQGRRIAALPSRPTAKLLSTAARVKIFGCGDNLWEYNFT